MSGRGVAARGSGATGEGGNAVSPEAAAEGVRLTAAGVRRGIRSGASALLSLLPFGLVCGISAQGHGLSLAASELMSGLVFGGSAELVALSHWLPGEGAPVLGAGLAALVVCLRYVVMGPVLSPWLDRLRGLRPWVLLATMVDQTWALAVVEINRGGRDAGFLLGGGMLLWVGWMLSTTAGFLLGAAMRPPEGHPLFFAALAVFVAMLPPLWRGRGDLLPWAVAAVVALLVARVLPGTSWYIIAGALAGALTGAMRDGRKKGVLF